MKRLVLLIVAAGAVALASAGLAKADPRISASAVVNSDRSVSISWNVPAASWGGSLIINPTTLTDVTGALPFDAVGDETIEYDLLNTGMTSYRTLPLDMTITEPTTIYLQVQLIDPFNDGTCEQGSFYTECDSDVIPLTIQPICTQVLVTAGYYQTVTTAAGYYKTVTVTPAHYVKKLVKRAHYVIRMGRRVKVKAKYRKVLVPAVTEQVWVPPVTQQQWVAPVYSTSCH